MRCVAGAAPRPRIVIGVGVVAEAEDEVAWAVGEGLAGVDGAALRVEVPAPPDMQEMSRGFFLQKMRVTLQVRQFQLMAGYIYKRR